MVDLIASDKGLLPALMVIAIVGCEAKQSSTTTSDSKELADKTRTYLKIA